MNRRITRWFTVAVPLVVASSVVGAPPASADVPGAGIVKDVLSGASGWVWASVTGGIASWVLGAVAYFVDGVINFLKKSARPDVTAGWFAGAGSPFATVRNLAGVLLAGFVLLGLLQGLLHGDPAAMVRRMAADLPLAVLGMVATVVVVDKLVELTDALSTTVLSNADDQALRFLSGFGVTASLSSGGFAAVVVGLVAVAAAFLLWVELMVRSALIYLLVAVSPLAFAAMVWPAARGVLRRTVQLLAAVVLSKLAVAVALAVGVAALGGADQTGGAIAGASTLGAGDALAAGMGTLFVGTTLLCLAAFAPFLVLQLIPLAEGALVAQGISRGPVRAAQSGLGAYSTTTSLTRLSGDRGAAVPAGLSGGSTVPGAGVGGASAAPGAAGGPTIAGAAVSAAGTTAKRVRSTVERSATDITTPQRPEPPPSRPRGSGAPPVPPPGRPTPSKRSES
jgi:hypothetical protein